MYEPQFAPTHVVPHGGLPAWPEPRRGNRPGRPSARLDPLLPVHAADREGDWCRIVCANGWSAWVDGRLLVPVPADPPAASGEQVVADDPGRLLARVEQAVGHYLRAVQDRAQGRTDAEGFRRHTEGMRAGLVLDGEAAWLYDPERDRWCYCDGTVLTPYAVTGEPSGGPAAAEPSGQAPAPTRPAAWQPTRTDQP